MSESLLDNLALRPAGGWLRDRWLYAIALAAFPVAFGMRALTDVAETEPTPDLSWLVGFLVWQPLVEELLFRGVLQGQLGRTRGGRWQCRGISGANLLASALFVLAHASHHAPAWAVAVFVPSLAFGLMRDRHGSIYPGLLLHAVCNGAYVLAGLP